jgi:drug/metabolite transporter (DMT)-like permease
MQNVQTNSNIHNILNSCDLLLDIAVSGALFAIGNMVLSGIANVLVKAQKGKLKPGAMLFIQSIISGILFIIITAAMGDFMLMFTIGWKAFLPLFFAAVLGIIIGNAMYFTSLELIGLSKAYPIAMTYPLFTYIFEIAFLGEEFRLPKLSGIILVIIGVILISSSKVNGNNGSKEEVKIKSNDEENELSEEVINNEIAEIEPTNVEITNEKSGYFRTNAGKIFLGVLLAALTTLTWSGGTTLIKVGLNILDAAGNDVGIIPINGARMFCLIPITLIIFTVTDRGDSKSEFNWKPILLVSIASVLSLVVSNILYLYALDLIGTSTPAAIAASGPIIATPLSILFLKEKVDWKIILGTLLTVGGILLVLLL